MILQKEDVPKAMLHKISFTLLYIMHLLNQRQYGLVE